MKGISRLTTVEPLFRDSFFLTSRVYRDGCETWSLILMVESRLRAFEHRVTRRIFGCKREVVTGGRKKLRSESIIVLS